MDISMELGINSGTLLVPPPSPLVFTERPLLQMRVSFLGQLDESLTSHPAPARSALPLEVTPPLSWNLDKPRPQFKISTEIWQWMRGCQVKLS